MKMEDLIKALAGNKSMTDVVDQPAAPLLFPSDGLMDSFFPHEIGGDLRILPMYPPPEPWPCADSVSATQAKVTRHLEHGGDVFFHVA
jgi:hypothetical protein